MWTMSDSSPADLAIMFRSVPRRLREARGELADELIGPQLSSIGRRLTRAGELVRTTADPASIADAIESAPADTWGSELDELRTLAFDLARDLRAIAAANPDLDG